MRINCVSNVRFLLGLSASVLLLRLAIFDFGEYFERRSQPGHDAYHGAGLFCPSMHSMRLTGDLAWWNPAGEHGGYAQYYNAFLSPLAPTNGHAVTIVWAQLIRILAWLGVAIPEYLQYLLVNLVLFPCLTYLAVAYLAQRLFRSRTCVALIVIVYAFSGIGLWNSAWFYFQEPATLFFLLGTLIAACQRPTLRRGLALLAAILIQLASANYWTVYNSWFLVLVSGTYALIYRNQVKRLAVRTLVAVGQRRALAAFLATTCLLVVGVWLGTLGLVFKEQTGKYFRRLTWLESHTSYTEQQAYERVLELRNHTTDLFNPKLSRAITNYPHSNEMHQARYLGAVLLPLLVAFWFVPLGRRELWLLLTTGLVWIVCLAPPWLIKAWATLPFMHNILHLFCFYTHYLQFLLVLLAATVLDRILAGGLCRQSRQRLGQALQLLCVAGVLVLVGLGVMTDQFPANNSSLEAMLLVAVLGLVGAFLSWQCLIDFRPSHRWAVSSLLLAVLTTDLTRYYWEVNRIDQQFTLRRFGRLPQSVRSLPLQPDIRAALKRPWQMPQDSLARLFENMPIPNNVWPNNAYNRHRHVHEWNLLPADARQGLVTAPLALHTSPAATSQHGDLYQGPGDPGLRILSQQFSYNDFAFDFYAPQAGIAVIGLLPDPAWRVTLDGQRVVTTRANIVAQSLSVPPGTHQLRLNYEPLSRSLYWPACWILEAVLAALAAIAITNPGGRLRSQHHAAAAQTSLAGPWYRRKREVITSCRE